MTVWQKEEIVNEFTYRWNLRKLKLTEEKFDYASLELGKRGVG